jgi:D-sedoheptulose 7-phosphate isomerase
MDNECDMSAEDFVVAELGQLRAALDSLAQSPYPELLSAVVQTVLVSLRQGGKVLFCGNGGSAADAQHLAAELVGRQNFNRAAAAGLALTVDSSALTALANDYGYDKVFSRQVEALATPGDVLFGISTSGRSRNVVEALKVGELLGVATVAMTGSDPGDMCMARHVINVPSSDTARIQEMHITCGHIIFARVEHELFTSAPADA